MRLALVTAAILLVASTAQAANPPPGLQPGDTYQRIFVTSFDARVVSFNDFPPEVGEFGSVVGGDWNVNRAAANAGLLPGWNGTDLPWKAILSDSTTDARDHISVLGRVYNMNNELVATSAADLWDGTLLHAIRYDEFGVAVANETRVWSGTNGLGESIPGQNALNWHDPNNNTAVIGAPLSTTSDWIASYYLFSNTANRLYGISPVLTVPAPEPSSFILMGMGAVGLLLAAIRKRG